MRPVGIVLLLGLFLAACAKQWMPLRDPRELLPVESARKICREHARREARVWHSGMGRTTEREPTIDSGRYQMELHRCMRHHGWVLRAVGDV